MILKQIFPRWYHLRKPRVISQNQKSLTEYRKALTAARRQVHADAKQYQDMIEDQYLQNHAQEMKQRHFNNQCEFRKKIAQEGFKLTQNLEFWKRQDEKTSQKFNKYLHNEDLKRINRERIKKIMTFESQNYWYTSQNAEQRLTDEVIFPSYIASTQYYHRLHSQALLYENYDFNLLHRVRSNEEVIKQKNKQLILLFNSIKAKIKQYKTDKQKEINYNHQIALDKIKLLNNITEAERTKMIAHENQQHQKKVKQYRQRLTDPTKRQNFIRQKLRVLLSIFGSWKEYTNILGMTSGQMMQEIQQARRQGNITSIRNNVMKQIRSVKNTTFVDAIQEDTQDVQITLEDYVSHLKDLKIDDNQTLNPKESIQHLQLEGLIHQAQKSLKQQKVDLTQPKQPHAKINLEGVVSGIQHPNELETSELPLTFLNVNQTTASIEVMKQFYQNDSQMVRLLNQIGQVTVDYPKLFKTVWQNTHSVV